MLSRVGATEWNMNLKHTGKSEVEELFPCEHCGRTFFALSLIKHQSHCAKQKMDNRNSRGDCENQYSQQDYKDSLSTMSSMLEIGRERRQRWRLRHEEFLHTLRGLRTNVDTFSAPELTSSPVTQSVDQLDLKKCPYCARSFNETSFLKHVAHCEDLSMRMKSCGPETEKRNEALDKFKTRMKYRPVLQSTRSENGTTSQVSDIDASDFANSFTPYPSPTSSISITEASCSTNGLSEVCGTEPSPYHMWSCPPVTGLTSSPWDVVFQSSNCNHLQSQTSKQLDRNNLASTVINRTPIARTNVLQSDDRPTAPSMFIDEPELDVSLPVQCSSPSTASSLSTISFIASSPSMKQKPDVRTNIETIEKATAHHQHHPWSPTVSSFGGRFQVALDCSSNSVSTKLIHNNSPVSIGQTSKVTNCIDREDQIDSMESTCSANISSPVFNTRTLPTKASTLHGLKKCSDRSIKFSHLGDTVSECSEKLQSAFSCSSELINAPRYGPYDDGEHSTITGRSADIVQSRYRCPHCHRQKSQQRHGCKHSRHRAKPRQMQEEREEPSVHFVCHLRGKNQQLGEAQLIRCPVSQSLSPKTKSPPAQYPTDCDIPDEHLSSGTKSHQWDCDQVTEFHEPSTLFAKDPAETENSHVSVERSGNFMTASSILKTCQTKPGKVSASSSPKFEIKDMSESEKKCNSPFEFTEPTETNRKNRMKSESQAIDLILPTYVPGAPTTMILTKAMLQQKHCRFWDKRTDEEKCDNFCTNNVSQSCTALHVNGTGNTESVSDHTLENTNTGFCHECGKRYATQSAKYCSHCGTLRIWDLADQRHAIRKNASKSYFSDQLTSMWTHLSYPSIATSCSFQ